MNRLRLFFSLCVRAAAIAAADCVLRYLFPFPLNQLNVVLVCLMWFSVFGASGWALAALALPVIIQEILSPLPFGAQLIALLISALCGRWTARRVMSGHQLLRVAGAGAAGAVAYLASLNLISYAAAGAAALLSLPLLTTAAWAVALSSVSLVVCYMLLIRKNPRLQNNYLSDFKK